MSDARLVRGAHAGIGTCPGCAKCSALRDDLFARAWRRVRHSQNLLQYWDILLSDGHADIDHLRWVIGGEVREIVAWAKRIREDSDADG